MRDLPLDLRMTFQRPPMGSRPTLPLFEAIQRIQSLLNICLELTMHGSTSTSIGQVLWGIAGPVVEYQANCCYPEKLHGPRPEMMTHQTSVLATVVASAP